MAALQAVFGFNRKQLAITLIVSTCAAVGVAFAFHSALWSVPPWSLQQSYSPKYTEADFPSWFTQGREELFGSFVFLLSSPIAGDVVSSVAFRE